MPGAAPGAVKFPTVWDRLLCEVSRLGARFGLERREGPILQFTFITWRGCPILAAQRAD